MANEINVAASLSCSKSGITVSCSASATVTIAGNNFGEQIFTTSTSGALVPVGGLTTYNGWFMLKNMDPTNNIGIYQDGASATVLISTLLPGDFILLKPAAALGCKSVAGSPDLSITAIEP